MLKVAKENRLRNMGNNVNHKKLHHIYKQMGMPSRRKVKKHLPVWVKEPLQVPKKFTLTWSIDFVSDVLNFSTHTLTIIIWYSRYSLVFSIEILAILQKKHDCRLSIC